MPTVLDASTTDLSRMHGEIPGDLERPLPAFSILSIWEGECGELSRVEEVGRLQMGNRAGFARVDGRGFDAYLHGGLGGVLFSSSSTVPWTSGTALLDVVTII